MRPSFDSVCMNIAQINSERSTCLRRKVGAIIVLNGHQQTSGYNGAPKNLQHCTEIGECLREKLNIPSGERHEICRGVHAEANAIIQAAKFGVSIYGGTLYCTCYPCSFCTRMIINAGIVEIIYCDNYEDNLAKELLIASGIKIKKFFK
jgi:dCMP deaminase